MWLMIAIHINPRTWLYAELLSLSAARRGGELLPGDLATASAETIRFAGPSTLRNRRSERTAHPERHTISNGSHFCGSAPAWQLERGVQPLPTADVREVLPAFCLRGDRFRWPSFFPISRAVIHTLRSDHMTVKRSELHMSTSQLAATAFEIRDRNSLDRVAVNSHVRHRRHVLDQKPLWPALHDDPACVLQHLARVLHAVMIGLGAKCVRDREPLTRRARHDAIEPVRDALKVPDITAVILSAA